MLSWAIPRYAVEMLTKHVDSIKDLPTVNLHLESGAHKTGNRNLSSSLRPGKNQNKTSCNQVLGNVGFFYFMKD